MLNPPASRAPARIHLHASLTRRHWSNACCEPRRVRKRVWNFDIISRREEDIAVRERRAQRRNHMRPTTFAYCTVGNGRRCCPLLLPS